MSFLDVVKKSDLKVLTFDIENAPNQVYTWGLFNQNIGINQVIEPARTFGFGAKWYHEKKAFFLSEHVLGREEMIRQSHAVLNEADILVSYNGIGFDSKHMNREFALLGLPPAKPVKHIDLLRVVRSQFRMTSNKLDHVAEYFGLGNKTAHTGFDLWSRCMAGEEAAWKLMDKYCKQDVKLTEDLYNVLRPWIPNHPHMGVWMDKDWVCSNCGTDINPEKPSDKLAVAQVTGYNLYQCACGHWLRGTTIQTEKIKTRSAR